MKASVVSLIALAGLATAASAQPVVQYQVTEYVVNSWTEDTDNGTTVHLYDGQDSSDLFAGLTPGDTLNPGQSLLLRVQMHMPTWGQTFAGSGTLPLRAFGTATFDLSVGNGLGTSIDAGSAPTSMAGYTGGIAFTEWEDLVENISNPGSPLAIILGPDMANRIVPAQVPGFTSPLNAEQTPWVVDLVITPTDYSGRTATWSLSAGRDVLVYAGTGNTGSNWQEHVATLAALSGEFTIVPAPASLALLGLGGLIAGRRRR